MTTPSDTPPEPQPTASGPMDAGSTQHRPATRRGGRWKWWLLVLSAFILGIGVGIFGTVLRQVSHMRKLVGEQPAIKAERIVNMLDRRLNLSEDQRARVEPIVDATQRELLEIRLAARPQVAGAIVTGIGDIRQVLEPEQEEKLDELINGYQEILGIDLQEQARLNRARTLGEPRPLPDDPLPPNPPTPAAVEE